MRESASERQERLYREALGAKAVERQKGAAMKINPCCGWRRDQGHHPLCANAPKEHVA